MLEKPIFEPDYHFRTTIVFYKIEHDKISLVKWLAYCHRSYYEKLNYYDLMGSILGCLNELFQW